MKRMSCKALVVTGFCFSLVAGCSSAVPGEENTSSSSSSSGAASSSSSSGQATSGGSGSSQAGSSSGASATSAPGSTSMMASSVGSGSGGSSAVPGSSSGGVGSSSGNASSGPACTVGGACTLAGSGGGQGILDAACGCVACGGDGECTTAYGPNQLCITGACVSGNCRAATDCDPGEVCTGNTCATCVATADCTTGYGSGYVCSTMGSCVMGDCATTLDCTGANDGKVCSSSNTCTTCAADNDCLNDAVHAAGTPARTICSAGLCVGNSCTASGTAASVTFCPGATQDNVCCAETPASTVGTCVPNTKARGGATRCCGTGQANCTSGQQCVGNYCSACEAVPTTGPGALTYFIDPANGNDSATGANAAGCQFKTLSRALTFVGNPGSPVTLVLLGDASRATGETFSYSLPANITIQGGSVSAPGAGATITPTQRVLNLEQPAGSPPVLGFRVANSNVRLSQLRLEGGNDNAARAFLGVLVSGNAVTNVTLDHLNIRNMVFAGIAVGESNQGVMVGGQATVGPGVVVDNSHGAAADSVAFGLLLTGAGRATVTGASGDRTEVTNTRGAAIGVSDAASIVIQGDAANATVRVKGSSFAGLAVAQLPGNATRAVSEVRGLVSVGNLHGAVLAGGSRVKVRNSIFLNNREQGVWVTASDNNAATAEQRNDVSAIDLGTTVSGAESGGNTLQATLSATGDDARNLGAGVCLTLGLAAAVGARSVNALGNGLISTTATQTNCSVTTDQVVARRDCSTPAASIPTSVGIGGLGHTVNVSNCTLRFPLTP
jgi:hypothetical protein